MAVPALLAGLSLSAAKTVGEKVLDSQLKNTNDHPDMRSAITNVAATSLAEISKLAEVEAITVIDNALTVYDSTTDVLKYLNSLLAGWYLSSAAIMTDTGRIKTVQLLERLNPAKSPSFAVANSILSAGVASMASSEIEVPEDKKPTGFLPTTSTSLEASVTPTPKPLSDSERKELNKLRDQDSFARQGPKLSSASNTSDLTTVQNLSVGQRVTLSISDGHVTKDISVGIRLITVPVQYNLLKTIMGWSEKDNRLKSRISAWRAGELSFWRDLVLMRDIFTERRRILMNDKSELLTSMLGRQRNSMVHSVMTLTPSVGTMSSMMVISSDSVRQIEREVLNGRLSNFATRQRVMAATGLMVLAVVDPMSELVTVYVHTQALPSEFSIKQMKSASKGGSSDLGEIIKLMNQNQMPNF